MSTFNLQKYSKKCEIPTKTKGKLDTQLFPECEGTDQDRNIVKNNMEKKTVEAARTKTVGELHELLTGKGHDKTRYDQVLNAVNEAYAKLSANPSASDEELEGLIVSEVAQKGFNAPSDNVDAIAAGIIHNNKKKRKVNQNLVSSPASVSQAVVTPPAPQTNQANPVEASTKKNVKLADCGSSGNNVITVTYPKDDTDPESIESEKTFDIAVPEEKQSENDISLAEWAYAQFQNENKSHNARKTRSSMVGDVFTVRGKHYVVLGIGWTELSCDEFERWKNVSPRDRLMAFNETKLKKMLAQAFSNSHILKLAGKLTRK